VPERRWVILFTISSFSSFKLSFLKALINIGFNSSYLVFNSSISLILRKSILLKTYILVWFAHIFSKISSTTFIFSSIFGSEASITCNSISDSIESSSVEEKASISFGGKSLINQIVSFIRISCGLI